MRYTLALTESPACRLRTRRPQPLTTGKRTSKGRCNRHCRYRGTQYRLHTTRCTQHIHSTRGPGHTKGDTLHDAHCTHCMLHVISCTLRGKLGHKLGSPTFRHRTFCRRPTFDTSTFRHFDILTERHFDTLTFCRRDILPPGHCVAETFCHPDIMSPRHFDTSGKKTQRNFLVHQFHNQL